MPKYHRRQRETAIQAINDVNDLFARLKHTEQTQHWFLTELAILRAKYRMSAFTQYFRGMVEGAIESCHLQLSHHSSPLVHGFWHNGTFHTTRTGTDNYYRNKGLKPDVVSALLQTLPSGLYWPSGKTYYVVDPVTKEEVLP